MSSLKSYHPTLHFTPWLLDLFICVPFQLPGEHTVLQPFRRIDVIIHIAIAVLPGTHFYLSQVKHLMVKCFSQDWEGRNTIIPKILHQAGFEIARQAATLAERHSITIAPCPFRHIRLGLIAMNCTVYHLIKFIKNLFIYFRHKGSLKYICTCFIIVNALALIFSIYLRL